jgi:hypothetical protein
MGTRQLHNIWYAESSENIDKTVFWVHTLFCYQERYIDVLSVVRRVVLYPIVAPISFEKLEPFATFDLPSIEVSHRYAYSYTSA